MMTSKKLLLIGLLLLTVPCASFGKDASDLVRLKSGEMPLLPFLEMVSVKLDIQIDASGLSGSDLGTIAIPEVGPVSADRAKALVLTALSLGHLTWIHDSSTDTYRVLRARDARDQEIPVISDESQLPDSDQLVTYIMNVANISPEAVARTLRSFMPANARVAADYASKTVLITDSSHNIAKLKKMVEDMDTPQAAAQAKEWLSKSMKKVDPSCLEQASDKVGPRPEILIALFSLIALVIGFLARGYVIRRIEGGL